MTMPLGEGAILQFICKGFMPPASKSTFQVLGTRKITVSLTWPFLKFLNILLECFGSYSSVFQSFMATFFIPHFWTPGIMNQL